jgi:N-acetylmuramoyl-L-alanine amidase
LPGPVTTRRRRHIAFALAVLLASALVAAPDATAQAGPSDPAQVRVTLDTSGASVRLILTHSRPVPFTVAAAEGRLEITYAEPVAFEPATHRLDAPVLSGWQGRGDRSLVLFTGPGYERYESFELRNPSRLVLDLHGGPQAPGAPPPAAPPAPGRARTVIVIDPGHGGVETGAIGPTGLQEKEVALDLARRLKSVLQRDAGVSVVLTRDEDRLVPLDERTAVANYNRADLFLSIHLNAARRRQATGAETYFLSPEATDDEARTVAALENRAYGVDETQLTYKGDGLELILWDLAQNRHLAESGQLAEAVQRELNALAGTRDRGVRQAPFRVLMGATMPAILVEAGFISNPEEEARLKDPAHRDRLVEAIARAVGEFRRSQTRLASPGAPPAGGGAP